MAIGGSGDGGGSGGSGPIRETMDAGGTPGLDGMAAATSSGTVAGAKGKLMAAPRVAGGTSRDGGGLGAATGLPPSRDATALAIASAAVGGDDGETATPAPAIGGSCCRKLLRGAF